MNLVWFIFRYLYWTDIGPTPKIAYMYLDGSNATAIIDQGVDVPLGFYVDINSRQVYWSQSTGYIYVIK